MYGLSNESSPALSTEAAVLGAGDSVRSMGLEAFFLEEVWTVAAAISFVGYRHVGRTIVVNRCWSWVWGSED